MSCVFVLKVTGLVTRKDLARYHLGKHGLEELGLTHPWPPPSLWWHWWRINPITSSTESHELRSVFQENKNSLPDFKVSDEKSRENRDAVQHFMKRIITRSRQLGVPRLSYHGGLRLRARVELRNIFCCTFTRTAPMFTVRLIVSLFIIAFCSGVVAKILSVLNSRLPFYTECLTVFIEIDLEIMVMCCWRKRCHVLCVLCFFP